MAELTNEEILSTLPPNQRRVLERLDQFKERVEKETLKDPFITEKQVKDYVDKIGEIINEFQNNDIKFDDKSLSDIKELLSHYIKYLLYNERFSLYEIEKDCSLSDFITIAVPHECPFRTDFTKYGLIAYTKDFKRILENSDFLKWFYQNNQPINSEAFKVFPIVKITIDNNYLILSDYKNNVIYSTNNERNPISDSYELISEEEYYGNYLL